eukprot:g19169.t1
MVPVCPPAMLARRSSRGKLDLFAASLFNTRTRRKYPAPGGAGWCPGDELALCLFTDAVLDGKVSPYVRSMKRPSSEELERPGVKELYGTSVELELLRPVQENHTEVLLLLYAPFCSYSQHFFWIWEQLTSAIQAATGPKDGRSPKDPSRGVERTPRSLSIVVEVASRTGRRVRHPQLPPVREFPTLLLCQSDAKDAGVDFLTYDGPGTLAAILSWISQRSAFAPPNLGAAAGELLSEGNTGESEQLDRPCVSTVSTRQYGGYFSWVGASYRLEVHHGVKPLQWLNRLTQRPCPCPAEARQNGFLSLPEKPLQADEALSKHYLELQSRPLSWQRPQEGFTGRWTCDSFHLVQPRVLPRPWPPENQCPARLRESLQTFSLQRRFRPRTSEDLIQLILDDDDDEDGDLFDEESSEERAAA